MIISACGAAFRAHETVAPPLASRFRIPDRGAWQKLKFESAIFFDDVAQRFEELETVHRLYGLL